MPPSIERGIQYTKEEIEDIFNTNFGYQISGINVRRDEKDQRYILLFAKEDGPYDDTVREGQFEYIGEGLQGDQDPSSVGNAALIDAIDTPTPIYFFYQGMTDSGWQYQGIVDVENHRWEERQGRQVLVFEMEHIEEEKRRHPGLYLVPVSDEWMPDFERTVARSVRIDEGAPEELAGYDRVRIWGTTETDSAKKQAHIEGLGPGDILLFYHDGDFFAGGVTDRVFEEPEVGEWLWNNPKSRFIFTVEDYTDSPPSIKRVWSLLNYEGRKVVPGFTRVDDDRTRRIADEYRSVKAALFEEPGPEEVEREKSKLEQAIEAEPRLTDEEEYTTSRRRARNQAFRKFVLEAYNETCAICGTRRNSPEGKPEVEAAHIYPKSEGGADDVRNGLALCRLHHWAFDVGWIGITEDHEITVYDDPNRDEYKEFQIFDGEELKCPENVKPHPKYLRARQSNRKGDL